MSGRPHDLRQAQIEQLLRALLPRGERRYFKERLETQIDVRLIGEVNDQAKQPSLAGAAALLFPIDWPRTDSAWS
jgi:hypothetical protein